MEDRHDPKAQTKSMWLALLYVILGVIMFGIIGPTLDHSGSEKLSPTEKRLRDRQLREAENR